MNENTTFSSDLSVDSISDSLVGIKIDLIVSGSIAAVESVKLIRSLRRLGADVFPWLTEGGSQFVSGLSLAWAANQETRSTFSGTISHLNTHDICIVAPASANFISSVVQSSSKDPCLALVQSYLGAKKPVFMIPTMHKSLWESPVLQENIKKLKNTSIEFLTPLTEEDKLKFPESNELADNISHKICSLNQNKNHSKVLITMGGTRACIDPVRYITNISSGLTGTTIATELYRQGMKTIVVTSPSLYMPKSYYKKIIIETNEQLEQAITNESYDMAVCAAAVADYTPINISTKKIKSEQEHLQINLNKTKKLLDIISPTVTKFVAFKLETDLDSQSSKSIVESYFKKHKITGLLFNKLSEISSSKHLANFFEYNKKDLKMLGLNNNSDIAKAIFHHLTSKSL